MSEKKYETAIADFCENEDCTPAEASQNPRCLQIARSFNKTPEQVALDINRYYIRSYRPL